MGNKLSYPEEDLTGKVAIVTGGNTGIGYETAKGLARLGAHTFIACRSKERAEAAIERMKAELNPGAKKEEKEEKEGDASADKESGGSEESKEPASEPAEGKEDAGGEGEVENKEAAGGEGEGKAEAEGEGEGAASDGKEATDGAEEVKSKPAESAKPILVEYLPLDLSSFQSTTDFVRAFKEKNLPLHILINNAAIAWIPFRLTADGYEEQFQVNHLGPMLLTLELLPILIETAATSGDVRIVLVSSGAHKQALPFNAEKLVIKEEREYDRLRTYPNTKLYNVMAGFALQRRLNDIGITVSSLEPGYVKTELARGWEDKTFISFLNKIGYAAVARTPKEGAATTLNCAVNPKLNTQKCHYYVSCKAIAPNFQSTVKNNQELLWQKTIEILKDLLSPETLEKYGEADVEVAPPPAKETQPPAEEPPTEKTEETPAEQTQEEPKAEEPTGQETEQEQKQTEQEQTEEPSTEQAPIEQTEEPPTTDQAEPPAAGDTSKEQEDPADA